MLEKAKDSLDNDSPGVRDISSLTLAIDPRDMPVAIEEIRKNCGSGFKRKDEWWKL